jgi:hypothetical protein
LAIKLALALTTPGVDVPGVLQAQRSATMRALQEYTRLKARADRPVDLSWRLVLDAMLFQAEAEIRWLDHCEASLLRHGPGPAAVADPGHEARGRATPGPAAPGRAAPERAAPGRAAPGRAAPERAAPGRAAPGRAVPPATIPPSEEARSR